MIDFGIGDGEAMEMSMETVLCVHGRTNMYL